jgi:hypothetical protein
MTPRKYENHGVTTSEDLPRLKMLAAAIRAEKAGVGNAMTTGPGLNVPCTCEVYLPEYLDPSRLTSQSNANQGTICTMHGPTHLLTPLSPAAAARDSVVEV